jgi:hypothetical protein
MPDGPVKLTVHIRSATEGGVAHSPYIRLSPPGNEVLDSTGSNVTPGERYNAAHIRH